MASRGEMEPTAGERPDVVLVSCRRLPEPDPDAAPLAAALAAAGIRAEARGWDDPGADWSGAPLTVLRSCWNYPRHHRAFLDWAADLAPRTRLWNPLPVIQWNIHKEYLLALADAGVPVAPTELIRRGEAEPLRSILERRGWREVVIKPAISAASFRTRRVGSEDLAAGEAHLRRLLQDGDALVQDYLPSVEGYGERSLIWIDGALTHAVRKSPRFAGQDESVPLQEVAMSPAEARLADRALAAAPGPLLYARIDVAPGPGGEPVLMELELMEPSLFFAACPAALARYVEGLRKRL